MSDVIFLINEAYTHREAILAGFGALIAATTVCAHVLSVFARAFAEIATKTENKFDDGVASFLIEASAAFSNALANVAARLPVVRQKGQ